ncbi:MAG: hypothetical protein M4579_005384 [Chaenotheca gracillima]|nr:MAG: hypothetical protein M4579_005384 [Chaenotheca gracillima]
MNFEDQLSRLQSYSACDIADGLAKLLPNRDVGPNPPKPYAPFGPYSPKLETQHKVVGPASTVLFIDSNKPAPTELSSSNIPSNEHYVDKTTAGTVVVMSQPSYQGNAVLGGIMAMRMQSLGAQGVVIDGQARDMAELRQIGFPVWARGTSHVGAKGHSKAHAINVSVTINGGTVVNPGDIMFCDPMEGIEVIPRNALHGLLELLPHVVNADEKVKHDVSKGGSVQEAFATHRG